MDIEQLKDARNMMSNLYMPFRLPEPHRTQLIVLENRAYPRGPEERETVLVEDDPYGGTAL